ARTPLFFRVALLLLVLSVTACGPATRRDQAPDVHIVRSGETLFTIAWRYGRDYRDLARWNRLGDGSLIYPGQVIRLDPPPGASAAPPRQSASAPERAPPR